MRFAFALAVTLATAGPALALTEAPAPGPVAVAIVENYLMPRYRTFETTTAEQAKAWTDACADGDFTPDLQALREAFQQAADGWAAVEHVGVGPASVGLRADRIYFGPDRRNFIAKALTELLSKARDADVADEQLRGASVAAQGFPALERLLFDPAGAEGPKARCRAGVAISRNLADIAAEIVRDWTAEGGPLARLKAGQGDPLHFADPGQALARLMTDLAGGVQRINDIKLIPAMGPAADAARPKAAEGWRSGRSARSIRLLTASLAEEAKAFAAFAPPDVAAGDARAFAAAQAAVGKLPEDVGAAAADPRRRKLLEAAIAALKVAQNDVAKNLAPAIGAPIGFNALDGD